MSGQMLGIYYERLHVYVMVMWKIYIYGKVENLQNGNLQWHYLHDLMQKERDDGAVGILVNSLIHDRV